MFSYFLTKTINHINEKKKTTTQPKTQKPKPYILELRTIRWGSHSR